MHLQEDFGGLEGEIVGDVSRDEGVEGDGVEFWGGGEDDVSGGEVVVDHVSGDDGIPGEDVLVGHLVEYAAGFMETALLCPGGYEAV